MNLIIKDDPRYDYVTRHQLKDNVNESTPWIETTSNCPDTDIYELMPILNTFPTWLINIYFRDVNIRGLEKFILTILKNIKEDERNQI
jgi:hypothetical protein